MGAGTPYVPIAIIVASSIPPIAPMAPMPPASMAPWPASGRITPPGWGRPCAGRERKGEAV
jgi:hypothetical protein